MTDDTQKAPAKKRAPRRRAKSAPACTADSSTRSETRANPNLEPTRAHAGKAPIPATLDRSSDRPGSARVLATIALHVRWRDLDALNHVNHAAYLTFLEEARLQWLRDVPGEWFNEHAMPVTDAAELHYRKPIAWPAEIEVRLTCERLGKSSVTIGHHIVDRNDPACIHATGNVVIVWVDPTTGGSVPLPEAIRAVCAA